MQYIFEDFYQTIFGQVLNVHEIFKSFFGEQFVDLQGLPSQSDLEQTIYDYTDISNISIDEPFEISEEQLFAIKTRLHNIAPFILVWWPNVTVTNENDKSINIQDLYAKIGVTLDGRIPYENRGFQLIRTTYSQIQYASGYSHSHIPAFSGIPTFQNPCLGSGPINGTILDLKNGYEEVLWMLFCQELALYVTVESLTGGPYFRLETVGSDAILPGYTDFSFESAKSIDDIIHLNDEFNTLIKLFVPYYLQHGHLSFNYKNNIFEVGMSYYDYMIDISNAFIAYFNECGSNELVSTLYSSNILVNALVSNGKFYRSRTANTDNSTYSYEGPNLFIFKNEWKALHIEREEQENVETITLLKHALAMYILQAILKTINYRYKNEYNNQLSSESSETPAKTYQTVCYL